MFFRKFVRFPGLLMRVGMIAIIMGMALGSIPASAASTPPIRAIHDSQLKLMFTTTGGADVLPTTRTVNHWWGSTFNPDDGLTYGYNMVGVDPNTCSGSACNQTIQVDITPIIVNLGGMTFDATHIIPATLASPEFATNDYGTTPAATDTSYARAPGGILSQGDAGIHLQLLDATMRAQFNQTGSSSDYHLRLHPNVLPAVTFDVPQNQGTLLKSDRGLIFAGVKINWWGSHINNLEQKADATHLALYLSDDVVLYYGQDPSNCCVGGYHGLRGSGYGYGSSRSNGNAVVQTFAWASYFSPALYARPKGGYYWNAQDILAVSHEVAEWADDPFVSNLVEPWQTPTAPEFGCLGILEDSDPIDPLGFAIGTNTFLQGPNPDGSQTADGYYHPEDVVFLPWFMRTAPNTISEPTQSPSTYIGRYSFMGDLNPFPSFHQPATGCG
jgi:hypothetical protein